MKLQLLSWIQNPTFKNKWDRVAFNNKNTFNVAWIWSEDNLFNVNVLEAASVIQMDAKAKSKVTTISKAGLTSLEDAKAFADAELKKQHFQI